MRILYLRNMPEAPNSPGPERARALVNGYASPGTTVDLGNPDDFAGARVITELSRQGALTGLHFAVATSALIRKTVWAEQQGYDAVVQGNHFDPGVEACRLAVRIPVIGLCRTSLHAAAALADRAGILVPLDVHVPYVHRMLRSYGLQDFVVDIAPLGVDPGAGSDKDEVRETAVKLIKAMVRDRGAECIVPLCAALIPFIVSPTELEALAGVPVTNNTAIGIRFAEMCVNLGMSQSSVTYPAAKLHYEDFAAQAY